LAHNFAALPAKSDAVVDPGSGKWKSFFNGVHELFPVYIAFVTSAAQPVAPTTFRNMINTIDFPVIAANAKILVMAA
jgi:hypothetical protein